MLSRDLFEELKRYTGFGREDAAVLEKLYPSLRDFFPTIVDDFYRRLRENERTRQVLTGEEQVERLKGILPNCRNRLTSRTAGGWARPIL